MRLLSRRTILRSLGTAALSVWPGSARAARLETIGLQLYTVRRDLEKDFEGTLAQVAKVGFREVETAGLRISFRCRRSALSR